MKDSHCSLCQSTNLILVLQSYFHCQSCELIFLDPEKRLSQTDEKARYLSHQGQNPEGHLAFLQPAIEFVLKNSQSDTQILDYGCGPDQVLANHLKKQGLKVTAFDPIFFPNGLDFKNKLNKFEIIVSTEVFEHFFEPRLEIEKLIGLLAPRGKIVAMTSFHQGVSHFETWSYRRDSTHVSFYSERTVKWLANHFNFAIEIFEMPNFMVLSR